MSFVKITGEASGEGVAEAAGAGVSKAAIDLPEGAQPAGSVIGALSHQGAAPTGAAVIGADGVGGGIVAGATPGFVGGMAGGAGGGAAAGIVGAVGGLTGAAGGIAGTVGAAIGGQAGNVIGAVGGIAGAAGGIASAAGGIAGKVGGIAGAAGGVAGAVAGIAGAAAGIAGAAGGIAGAAGGIAGAAGGIAGAAGGIAGAAGGIAGAAGGAAGAIGGKLSGGGIAGAAGGIIGEAEMPVFADIAVTSKVSGAVKGVKDQLKDAIGGIGGAVMDALSGKNLEVEVASGDQLDVRQFSAHERMSSLFQINIIAVSDNPSIDFDAVVGMDARFAVNAGAHGRSWTGVCNHFEQVRVEAGGSSTYQLSIVPRLWLLTQRKNYRIHQQISEPDIVLKILKEWEIEVDVRIDSGAYKKRKYRVQYAESDFAFMSRMLEDAGIAYYFEQQGETTKLVLSDSPHTNPKRGGSLSFVDDTSMVKKGNNEIVTAVRMGQRVRPGKVTMRDHDYRRPPSYKLMTTASGGRDVESKLERFHYTPGAFLFGTDQGEASPVADDRGKTRTDEKEGAVLAQKRLDAKRGSARVCTFETNAHDLAPGVVMSMSNHPNEALGEGKKFLLIESSLNGTATGEWSHHCEARGTEVPYRPELVTPRPTVNGVESATVVGPKGEEIHTDEFGRVRCHFHWDRESQMDDKSSCWIHVSQPWGGTGYGGTALPRVGQEVLVDFLGGDPDRPVIVGRLYTNLQKTPYKLPENKTQSGLKSNSTGGGGGYNELMFEDAAGRELVNIQAQKDLTQLVKHDETTTTWNNNTNLVGTKHSLTIGKPAEGKQPGTYAPTAGPTSVTMTHERIELTTGKASIILDGPNIIFKADQDISATALLNIALFAAVSNINVTAGLGQVSLMGMMGLGITSPSVIRIDGTTAVLINCTEPKTETVSEEGSSFWGTVGAVALGLGVAAAIISAPVVAGVVIGGALAYGALSN